jgi:hypothetical protein
MERNGTLYLVWEVCGYTIRHRGKENVKIVSRKTIPSLDGRFFNNYNPLSFRDEESIFENYA